MMIVRVKNLALLLSVVLLAACPPVVIGQGVLDVFVYEPCRVCPAGEHVAKRSVVLPAGRGGILQEDTTCAQVEADARKGLFSEASCIFLKMIVPDDCGCEDMQAPVPVPAPRPRPTGRPVSQPDPPTRPVSVPIRTPDSTKAPAPKPSAPRPSLPVPMPVKRPVADPTPQRPSAPADPTAPTPSPVAPSPVLVVTPAPAAGSPSDDDDDGLSQGAIIGIVFGAAVAAVFLAYLCFGVLRRKAEPRPPIVPAAVAPVPPAPEPRRKTLWNNPNPPVIKKPPPIASVAAVSAAREGSTVQTSTIEVGKASFSGDTVVSSLQPQMMSRVVQAPHGRLGIVIDATLEGPVVHQVKDDSPLKGQIFPGDLIAAINDVDTRAMSIPAITSLLERTASNKRKMTVLSRDYTDGDEPAPPVVTPTSKVQSVNVDDSSVATESSLRTDMGARLVKVPPGRLGLVIETTADGPTVNQVKPDSKLKGLVFEGDVVAAVDDIDTRKFTAEELTALLASKSKTTRRLKVLSRDITDAETGQLKPNVPMEAPTISDASTVSSTLRIDMNARIVKVPPGRLGIIIDTTVDGPVVKQVKEDSPLRGLIFENDLIAAVDGVDTRAMSGEALTSLISRTAKKTRRLTVLSRDVSDGGSFVSVATRPVAGAAVPTTGNTSTVPVSFAEVSTTGSTSTVSRPDVGVRTIKVPPGRLGIVLQSTPDGPVVQSVKDDSPLRGLIFEGDVIVAVNEVDTSAMSGAALTSLVARTSKMTRRMKVVSRDISDSVQAAEALDAPASDSTSISTYPVGDVRPAAVVVAAAILGSAGVLGSRADTPSKPEGPGSAPAIAAADRRIEVPEGKLGIVVDKTSDGAVVTQVKKGSPLEDLVAPGEVIASINGIETAGLSASDFTSLMARTASSSRVIVVRSRTLSVQAVEPVESVSSVQPEETQPTGKSIATPQDVTNTFTREIEAPPGRLGIFIMTTPEGPVINRLKEDSPLQGKVTIGDAITSINGVDTRAMSGAALTSLIARTADSLRKITLLSSTRIEDQPGSGATTAQPEEPGQVRPTQASRMLEDDESVSSTLRRSMSARRVKAPPGQLGLTTNATDDGHVVTSVKTDSSMHGLIFPGDVIIAVDSVETKGMTGSDLANLMAASGKKTRLLTVVSKDFSESTVSPSIAVAETDRSARVSTIGAEPSSAPPSQAPIQRDDIESVLSTLRTNMGTRRIKVPPEKLGVIVDITDEGPVVKSVKSSSPLQGLVFPDDLIVAVDSTSTIGMSGSDLAKLLADSAKKTSVLTIVSKDLSDTDVRPPVAVVSTMRAVDAPLVAVAPIPEIVKSGQVAATASPDVVTKTAPVPTPPAFDEPGADTDSVSSTLRTNMGTRRIKVPPEKLGVIVDITDEGPVVKSVKSSSPLQGLVFPDDLIVAVNSTSTIGISGSDLAKLLTDSAKKTSVLTIVSKDLSDTDVRPPVAVDAPLVAVAPIPEIVKSGQVAATASPDVVTKTAPEPTPPAFDEPGADTDSVSSAMRTNVGTRQVKVPPAKLGVIVDVTEEGPVVKSVKSDSPLLGLVFPDDLIVAVDNTNTRGLSGSDLAKLLADSAKQMRVFTILSRDLSDKDAPTPVVGSFATASTTVEGTSESIPRTDMSTLTFTAPPGKLKLVIGESDDGPVVKIVKPDSPLKGLIFAGDILVQVNGRATKGLSGSDLTQLMVETTDISRDLVVLRRDVSGTQPDQEATQVSDKARSSESPKAAVADEPVSSTDEISAPDENEARVSDLVETSFLAPSGQAIVAEDTETTQVTDDAGTLSDEAMSSEVSKSVVADEPVSASDEISAPEESEGRGSEVISTRVLAPSGKLGIVVDASTAGPVIVSVKRASPMRDILSTGDIIIEVNGVDTRAMSSAALTSLMSRTQFEERSILVLRRTGASSPIDQHDSEQVMPGSLESPVTGAGAVDSDGPVSESASGSIEKVVTIPPGLKLGIVINSTEEGPVVMNVKPDSPLRGLVTVGDVIVSLNGVDTAAMSHSALIALVARSASTERTFVVRGQQQQASAASVPETMESGTSAESIIAAPPVEGGVVAGAAEQITADPIDGSELAGAEMTEETRSQVQGSEAPAARNVAGVAGVTDEDAAGDIEGADASKLEAIVPESVLPTALSAEAATAPEATSQVQDVDSAGSATTEPSYTTSRVVQIPPGKLGVSIDTTADGPVVRRVKSDSPLQGILFPGDIILAVDDESTREMSGSAITSLMVRTAGNVRSLTVLSAGNVESAESEQVTSSGPIAAEATATATDKVMISEEARGEESRSVAEVTGTQESQDEVVEPDGANALSTGEDETMLEGTPSLDEAPAFDEADEQAVIEQTEAKEDEEAKLEGGEEEKQDYPSADVRAQPAVVMAAASTTAVVVAATSGTVLTTVQEEELSRGGDTDGESTVETSPSLIPASTASSADEESVRDDDTVSSLGSATPAIRRVEAPPGRLGIVLDTTAAGPLVISVKPESPMVGLVYPGDTILAVDDVETRAMSSSAFTSLMVRTASATRILTVTSTTPPP